MNQAIDWAWVVPALIVGTMGWVIYLAGMPIIGLCVGAGGGAMLGEMASRVLNVTASWGPASLIVVGALAGGGLGFWLIRLFQIYLFFIVGASVGGAIGLKLLDSAIVTSLIPPSVGGTSLVAGLAAVAGGIVCVQMRRFVIAIVTSVLGVFLLLPGLPKEWQGAAMVIALATFLAIQIGLVKRFVAKEAFDRRARVHVDRRLDRPGEGD